MSFQDGVLKRARREAIADQLDACNLALQLLLQTAHGFAAEGINEPIKRPQDFFPVAPNVPGDRLISVEQDHLQMAMKLHAPGEEPLENRRAGGGTEEAADGPLGSDDVDLFAAVEQIVGDG